MLQATFESLDVKARIRSSGTAPKDLRNGFDPSWYAKDVNGDYVRSQQDQNWLMDVTNTGWIQNRAQLWARSSPSTST